MSLFFYAGLLTSFFAFTLIDKIWVAVAIGFLSAIFIVCTILILHGASAQEALEILYKVAPEGLFAVLLVYLAKRIFRYKK